MNLLLDTHALLRWLVAQAKVEGFASVSRDLVFAKCGIAVIGA